MIQRSFSVLKTLTHKKNAMLINKMMPTFQSKKIKIILHSVAEIFYNSLNLSFQLNLIKLSFQIYLMNHKTITVLNRFLLNKMDNNHLRKLKKKSSR